MDKNKIKIALFNRFISEEKTPGISITASAQKKSGTINKTGVKAIETDVKAYDKSLKQDSETSKVGQNKFNYTDDAEKTYHDELEILNGQEMIEYNSEPTADFKDRAIEAIEGSSRMGNAIGGNAEAVWGASSDDFGKDLVKRIKGSSEKRAKAEIQTYGMGDVQIPTGNKVQTAITAVSAKGVKSSKSIKESVSELGAGYTDFAINKTNGKIYDGWDYSDIEKSDKLYYAKEDLKNNFPDENQKDFTLVSRSYLVKKGLNPSDTNNWYKSVSEGDEQESKKIENGYGSEEENEFNNQQKTSKPTTSENIHNTAQMGGVTTSKGTAGYVNDTSKMDNDYAESNRQFRKDMEGKKYGTGDKKNTNPDANGIGGADLQRENNNKNNPKIKESMKKLTFKKEFNGVGNALKMIPESYKTNNKEFVMTDGNENYTIRWEGTLTEGRAIVLTAEDKSLVNEDIARMKALFNYKSEDTLGTMKGASRITENSQFANIWSKSKQLLGESEDIEDETAETGDLDDAVKVAPEAKKHVGGSVSTDKGTKAPNPKKGEWEDITKKAPEATKHVEGSVSAKSGMGLGVKAKTGEWDQISVPQAAAHGTESSTTYAPAPKTGEWDKISVPQASDAKKHVHMGEGVVLGGILFEPIVEKN
jgi:hypothetical protein